MLGTGARSRALDTIVSCGVLVLIIGVAGESNRTDTRTSGAGNSTGDHVYFKEFLESPEAAEITIEMILNGTRDNRNTEDELTLITFLQRAVKNYGQKRVAKSLYELAQKPLYDLIWMLAGSLDTYLIFDLYKLYSAANSDPAALSVYERFRAGEVNRSIVPEVFALDKKYDRFEWYLRVRGRMLESVDKYIGGGWGSVGGVNTPPPIQYESGGVVVIAGVRIPQNGSYGGEGVGGQGASVPVPSQAVRRTTSTTVSILESLIEDSDEDLFEF